MANKRKPAQEEAAPWEDNSSEESDVPPWEGGWQETGGAGKAVEWLGTALSYPGDVVRGAVEKATGAAPELTARQIIRGEAPSYGKAYGGGGTLGEIGGGILSVATDPIAMAGPFAKGIQRLGLISKESKVPGMLSPMSRLQEKAGEGLYRQGMKAADEKFKLSFKPKEQWPSSYMMNAPVQRSVPMTGGRIGWQGTGAWGDVGDMRKAVLNRMQEVMQTREGLFDVADSLGVIINPEEALSSAYQKILNKAENLISDETFDPKLLDEAWNWLDQIKSKKTMRQASDQKTNLSLPEKFYRTSEKGERRPIPFAEDVQKEAQEGYRKNIIQQGERAQENLGENVNLANKEYESLKSATKPLRIEHRRELRQPFIQINPLLWNKLSNIPFLPTGSRSLTGSGLLMRKMTPLTEYILEPSGKKIIMELMREQENQSE